MIRHTFRILNCHNRNMSRLWNVHFGNISHISPTTLLSQSQKPTHPNLHQKRYIQLCHKNFARVFRDTENVYCFSILQKQDKLEETFKVRSVNNNISQLEEFNNLLDKNYRVASIEEIVQAFTDAKAYCIENNINLSDRRFDHLVDGLMDNCEFLSDELLYELLHRLSEFPECQSFDSHNYHDVWSCLDDICCWKMHEWDIDQTLLFGSLWYKLNLGKVSDYLYETVEKMSTKSKHLTKNQVLLAFFYLNICRKRYVDFELEDAAAKYIGEMSADEMAIIALGFFKSQSKVKIPNIIEEMMKKVIKESKTINEISLAAILKVVRLSRHGKLVDLMYTMLDKIVPEIDRLSHLTCLHLAIIGTSMQCMHKASLLKATEKLARDVQDVTKVRLKDIERLLMVLTMFDISSEQCCNFYELAYRELHSETRTSEKITHSRCVPCSLQFLSLRNMYSYDLMSRILDKDSIIEIYGKNARLLPKDLFALDVSIDIDCPEYKGNRLSLEKRYKAVKWQTEFIPSYDQYTKISTADKLFLDTVDTLKDVLKDEKLLYKDHVLPNFSKADVILCKDLIQNKFIEPFGFENYILGDVKFPFKDKNLKWYAVVIIGWNNTLRGSSIPLGSMLMKERQLKTIGYEPVLVIWNEFMTLPQKAKVQYLANKIL